MEWTVLLFPDGKVKNIHPGPKYGKARSIPQFTIEASNFLEATRKAYAELHLHRPEVAPKPPQPYRHPAFLPKGENVRETRLGRPPNVPLGPVVLYCQCKAQLSLGETMCVVCQHEAERAIKNGAMLEGFKPRTDRINEPHLRILLEVRRQWLKCQTVGRFAAWLTDEIYRVEHAVQAPTPAPEALLDSAPV